MHIQFIRLVFIAALITLVPNYEVFAKSTNFSVGLTITRSSSIDSQSRAKVTCNAAKTKISLNGYEDIEMLECSGNSYTFTAQFNSSLLNISFDALTGEITVI